ncbi:MAG: aminoglycoside phosphotransferase family protein, partial [Phycisphaerae bacterium]|nr:aminoglycoside phosphotransferase family protein [Phycisphaerae bacterium]
MADQIADVSRQFRIPGRFVDVCSFGRGHIHESCLATYEHEGSTARYLHQRINRHVFSDPDSLMRNIVHVTEHLRRRYRAADAPDAARRTLHVVRTLDGEPMFTTSSGDCWRTYRFIEGTRNYVVATNLEQVREAGRAFGEFQAFLADLPAPRLTETIPHFHDTRGRLAAFEQAVQQDAVGRTAAARAQIEFARAHAPLAGALLDLAASGIIPERIAHNDAKLDNLLFDSQTGTALCVVDLDTVMPGLSLYDFGDMARSMVCLAPEDEDDLSLVRVDADRFESLVRGYRVGAADLLTPTEIAHLVTAAKVITYEQGLRFLTDHLMGDAYYRISRPGHNLIRCRNQFYLLRGLCDREDELSARV